MANLNGVPYKLQIVSQSKWGVKCPYALNAKKITIHNTDNSASAQNEADYHNGNSAEVSYHIAVDESQAIQVLPLNRNGWASGDGGNGYGNRNTIHIEICRNYDRVRNSTNLSATQQNQYSKAEGNGIKVAAAIMVKEGIPANADNVKRHYDWSGKWCPSKILNENRWNTVRALIVAEAQRLSGQNVTPAPSKPSVPNVSLSLTKGTLAKWATTYQTGQKINPAVIGKTYAIIQEKAVNQSSSKKAYLLAGIMSWVLEQDIVEAKKGSSSTNVPAKTSPLKNGKVGDKVKVVDSLYADSTGKGRSTAKKGATGIIKRIQKGASKPYLVEGWGWAHANDVTLISNSIESKKPETGKATNISVPDSRWISKKGTAKITDPSGIRLRGVTPGDNVNPIKLGELTVLAKGSSVVYDRILVQKDGHVWVRQPRSGGFGWLPVGSTKDGKLTGSYWVSGVSI